MPRVIMKFTDGTHINVEADYLDLVDGRFVAMRGNKLIAIAKGENVDVCYMSEKKEG